ncbi:pilus assembly protein [Oceanicoccus sp. KOV_DT_Chl]|uniref:pilus assembly protein n=1 Tax=Oceanicoccus sp. KOV_DT_Chl TaxID=1904639 RepID=UPI001359E2B6|nr:PilC/PilY family type IV pilus protein [Oceanicoccus sp. KOV_DT_Chl]
MNTFTSTGSKVTAAIFMLLASATTWADDTEVYLEQSALEDYEIRPNVLFIMDTSGSMGLPVDANNGTSSEEERNNFNSNTTYPSEVNYSGGAGDSDYVYLYSKPNTFADQYIYFNKVHRTQFTCNTSTLNDTTPYETSTTKYVYETGGTWDSASVNSRTSAQMCFYGDASCGFVPEENGARVDCQDEKDYITYDSRYTDGSADVSLYAVSANYHNYLQNYYRYTALQQVVRDLIDQNYDINLSLMRFNSGSGGYIFQESLLAEDTTDASNANQLTLRNSVDALYEFDDSTPLSEVLWEGYRYMRGLHADWGNNSGTNTPSAAYSSGSTYNSPIDYECQKSYLILLTDGAPTSDGGSNADIQNHFGGTCSGNCLDELAGMIHYDGADERDHSSLDLTQPMTVHTVGFGAATDEDLLIDTARNGGGEYKQADSAAELLLALKELFKQTEFEKDTFVAPAVAVNAYNGLQHRDELYFALFQPASTPRWTGNIKKYKLKNGKLVDANNAEAVDTNTGYFKNSALSYWTTQTNWAPGVDYDIDGDDNDIEPDGSQISLGGFAYEFAAPASRNILTYMGSAPTLPSTGGVSLTTQLPTPITSSTVVTTVDLGLGASDATTEAIATNVVDFARGGAVGETVSNHFLADFVHNQPTVVTYRTIDADNDEFDDTLFAASNMGFFHAIDADDGSEIFSYIPKELLPNLTTYYQNSGTFSDKVYGLDSPMAVWRHDDNKNGSIVTAAGIVETDEHVYIYQGMRRGGKTLYALDVSNRSVPKLLWQVTGGGGTNGTSGFDDLGQTWSVPQRATIKTWGCTPPADDSHACDREVLFFGGGYDTKHDTAPDSSDDEGNAIFMVDATTGELLWSAGKTGHTINSTDMTNSFPANVTPADITGDGYIDFLFAVDVLGSLWRFDFDIEANSANDFATGGVIAELGGTGSELRRFYNAPDVSYQRERGVSAYLSIAIGSGWRAHPLNKDVNDYLFMIYDSHAFNVPTDYTYMGSDPIGLNHLATASLTNGIVSTPVNSSGWALALDSSLGEKMLTKTVTFDNQLLFSTFLPDASLSCDGKTGNGRYYFLDVLSGQSVLSNNRLFQELEHGGIPPSPPLFFQPLIVATAVDQTKRLNQPLKTTSSRVLEQSALMTISI